MKSTALAALLALTLPAAAQITRISVTETGEELDGSSYRPWISDDGRWVSFISSAQNLSTLDDPNVSDAFRVDLLTGHRELVSVDGSGAGGTSHSSRPRVTSGSGAVFFTTESDLSGTDSDGLRDVYLRDPQDLTTKLVSLGSNGENLAFDTDIDVACTPDERYLVWTSTGQVAGGASGGSMKILRSHVPSGDVVQISVGLGGAEPNDNSHAPEISADGRYVVFHSWASNLVPGDVNDTADIFLHDVVFGTTVRLSQTAAGVGGDGSSKDAHISSDGRYVVFESRASNLAGPSSSNTKVFRVDTHTGEILDVSVDDAGRPANDDCQDPFVSPNGEFVAFESYASNWWNGADQSVESNIYVRDVPEGRLHLISRSAPGYGVDHHSADPVIAKISDQVVFESASPDLVSDDGNGVRDVFISPMLPETPWTLAIETGLEGTTLPTLHVRGWFTGGEVTRFDVTDAQPSMPGVLVMGGERLDLPILGGYLVPDPVLVLPLMTDANGKASYDSLTPMTFPAGTELWFQAVVLDPGGPQGVAFTDAVHGLSH